MIESNPSSRDDAKPDAGSAIGFPETRWTLMLQIRSSAPERAQELIGELCVLYQPAIAAYFRLKCRDPQQAEDLAQMFHQHLLQRNRLEHLERRPNTRFRNFLATALRNFWLDHRHPQSQPLSAETEPSELPRSERILDQRIAAQMHIRATGQLRDRFARASKLERFQVLEPFLLEEGTVEKYSPIGLRLGLTSNAVKKAVHDLRQSYYDAFRTEVAQIVERSELDEELRYLITLLPEALSSMGVRFG